MDSVYISGHTYRFPCSDSLKDRAKYSLSNTVVMPFGSDKDLLLSAERVCRQNINHMARALGIHASCPSRVVGAPEWTRSLRDGLLEYRLDVEFRLEVYIHGFDALMSDDGTVSPPEPDDGGDGE